VHKKVKQSSVSIRRCWITISSDYFCILLNIHAARQRKGVLF